MEFSNWIVFSLILSLIAVAGILRANKVQSSDMYLLAGRKTRLVALVATLVMTEFNTATLISFSAAGFYAGWWALSLPMIFLIGLLFYALSVAKKWNAFQGLSVSHYFSARYGRTMGWLACGILFFAMTGFSATYIKALNLVFAPFFPSISGWVLSGLLVLIIFLMTYRGGLIAIIRTDVISFIGTLLFLPMLLIYAYKLPIAVDATTFNFTQMQDALPPKFVGSLVLLTMFSYILAPWYGQKVISAHSSDIAKKAVIIAAILVFILYGLAVLACYQLALSGVKLENPELALPYLIKHALPQGLSGLGYAILYLAGATTLSGVWSAMVTLIFNNKPRAQQKSLHMSILLTATCALLSYVVANLFVDKVFNKMILANIPIVALSFALLAGFYWKHVTVRGVYVSIFCGLLVGLGSYFYYGENNGYTWYWAIYGIPTIFISGALTSLFDRRATKRNALPTGIEPLSN